MSQKQKMRTLPFVAGISSLILCMIVLPGNISYKMFRSGVSESRSYYLDSGMGNDSNTGLSANSPWKTLQNLRGLMLAPGDSIKFKTGSAFSGLLTIEASGSLDHYIVLTSYGDQSDKAPSFTNPVFGNGNYGNCIRLKGSFIKVENLYFENTPSFVSDETGDPSFLKIWEMGAIHVDRQAQHCIISNNEIADCPAAIRSNGKYITITGNYIHDCNRILKRWEWGPIGIWIGNDHQTITHNRIINYKVEDERIRWPQGVGGGADGSAFEIDDARYDKSHIEIAYNYTRDCQGFLEVTWTDVKQHPQYRNFKIHHNISDDYQQFVAIWQGRDFDIDHNTIVRRKVNANDWGVFNITGNETKNRIRNNIIVTEKNIQIFNTGLNRRHTPKNIISNNLYYAAEGSLVMGAEGPGAHPFYGDPLFRNYRTGTHAADFKLMDGSPALRNGQVLPYKRDYFGTDIPNWRRPTIGAFECPAQN